MVEMLTTKPPFSDMEPMAAIYNIGTGRRAPDLPENITIPLKDFLCQCLKRLVTIYFKPRYQSVCCEIEVCLPLYLDCNIKNSKFVRIR